MATQLQLDNLARAREARKQKLAERKETAAVSETQVLAEQDRLAIQQAMEEVEVREPVRERATSGPPEDAKPKTLADEVSEYFETRTDLEYGAAVDARHRDAQLEMRRALNERLRREPPKPKARPGESPAHAAQRYMEEERKRAAREAALPPVARDRDGNRLPVEHRLRTPMRAVRRYAPDTTRIDPALVGTDTETGLSNVPHWVSVEDRLGQGERSWNQVETMMAYGAEVIRKKNGEPLVSRFGVAMRQSPADYDNMVRSQAPRGVYDLDDLVEPVFDHARQINRKTSGGTSVFKMREHSMHREMERPDEIDGRYMDD